MHANEAGSLSASTYSDGAQRRRSERFAHTALTRRWGARTCCRQPAAANRARRSGRALAGRMQAPAGNALVDQQHGWVWEEHSRVVCMCRDGASEMGERANRSASEIEERRRNALFNVVFSGLLWNCVWASEAACTALCSSFFVCFRSARSLTKDAAISRQTTSLIVYMILSTSFGAPWALWPAGTH